MLAEAVVWFVTPWSYFGLEYLSFSTASTLGPVFRRWFASDSIHLSCCTNYSYSVQAIIFLAPLAFNQVLEEDPRVNRLVRVLLNVVG